MTFSTDDKLAISITLARVVIEAMLSKGLVTEQDLKNALTTVDFEKPLQEHVKLAVSALFVALPGDSAPGK